LSSKNATAFWKFTDHEISVIVTISLWSRGANSREHDRCTGEVPGIAIDNTGDLISRWTNGTFRSSPHRVVNPTGLTANKDRYSFVLFHSPNPDAAISCLEPCQGPDNPPKFGPITAGEHLRARAEASRRHGY